MVRACVRAVQTKTTPIGIEPKTLYGVIRTSTIYADICALQSDAMVSLLSTDRFQARAMDQQHPRQPASVRTSNSVDINSTTLMGCTDPPSHTPRQGGWRTSSMTSRGRTLLWNSCQRAQLR